MYSSRHLPRPSSRSFSQKYFLLFAASARLWGPCSRRGESLQYRVFIVTVHINSAQFIWTVTIKTSVTIKWRTYCNGLYQLSSVYMDRHNKTSVTIKRRIDCNDPYQLRWAFAVRRSRNDFARWKNGLWRWNFDTNSREYCTCSKYCILKVGIWHQLQQIHVQQIPFKKWL